MRAVIRFLKKKIAIRCVGILALCVLIWYAGPWLAIAGKSPLRPVINRLIAISAVLLIWIIIILFKQARAIRADKQLIAKLSESQVEQKEDGVAKAQDEEVNELKRVFEEALLKLKTARSKNRRDKQYLYELPWYMIIGAPGAGKTTALVNSGLTFPMLGQSGGTSVRGVGGTRNCDWFFAEEAIFLDTAGRYTTQDSHRPVDAAAWHGFLELIKKYRPRRPINGVLVTMSMSDLLQQSDAEINQHAIDLRKRIKELYEVLGVRFPLYMLFTKCDLIAGFTDFFEDLDQQGRSQVWGETFPGEDVAAVSDQIARFGDHFDEILKRLNTLVLRRIQEEPDIQRRGQILDFPQQMALVKPTLVRFLKDTFSGSRYEATPLLRGVYLTSGIQEGTPIDRVLGRLADVYGLDHQSQPVYSGRGKAYFIKQLLNEVIIPEAQLTGVDPLMERRRQRLQLAFYACLLVVVAGMSTLWAISYLRNRSSIKLVQDRITSYQSFKVQNAASKRQPERDLLARMNVLTAANEVYKDRTWLREFGLYQGEKLLSQINRVYRQLLGNEFLQLIQSQLEHRLRWGLTSGNILPEELYDLLKVYLMLGTPGKIDPPLAENIIAQQWERLYFREPQVYKALAAHTHLLLNDLPGPIQLEPFLVNGAREKLNSIPLSMQIYAHLKSEAFKENSRDFRLAEHIGRYGDQVFQGQVIQKGKIPALFTLQGYTDLFKKQGVGFVQRALSQNWVLKNPAADRPTDLNRLYDDLEKLYFAEYEGQWMDLLNAIKIRRAKDINETIQLLDLLSGPDTPLRPLLEAIAENTALSANPPTGLSADSQGKKVDDPAKSSVYPKTRQGERMSLPLRQMENRFKALNALVQSTDRSPPALDNVLSRLAALRDDMMVIGNSAKSEEQALKMARDRMRGVGKNDTIRLAQLEFSRLPEPVRTWLQSLTNFGWKITLDTAKSQLNVIWQTDVLAPYKEGLEKRYPLFAGSAYDITMSDFCRFFAPNGILDIFFKNYLKPFIDTDRVQWRQVSMDDYGIQLSPTILKQFQNAAKIRQSFFTTGGSLPSVDFELKPLDLSEKAAAFRLEIEGQSLLYRHGPKRSSKLRWPGPQAEMGARLTFRTLDGREFSQFDDGPWAWFRLLDAADMEKTSLPDRYWVTFRQNGLEIRLELRASSVENPFNFIELRSFRCPGEL